MAEETVVARDRTNGVTISREEDTMHVTAHGTSWQMPWKGICIGYSPNAGYLFRDGSTLYALNILKKDNEDYVCYRTPIVEEVKTVIELNYRFSSDKFGTVLLQMEDNSLMVYIGNGISSSDEDLVSPVYEGDVSLHNVIE